MNEEILLARAYLSRVAEPPAAALVGLKAYGIDKADGLSFALVLHAVNFFPYVLAGGVVLALRRR